MERLQKYLSEAGVASRRAAEKLIAEGRVTVNGQPAKVGESVDPEADRVEVDGKPVQAAERLVYVLLNKPKGTITSTTDTRGRKTVMDCVATVPGRLFPVGRLDLDVEGALLLTNDGDLAYRLTHPRFEVDKVYLATVLGRVSPQAIRRLEEGVQLDDGMAAPAKVEILEIGPRTTVMQLTLHEGRKREVKRLCAAVGHPIQSLRRTSFAGLGLGTLKPGQWRYLKEKEVEALKK